jgi:hypothetical protein
MPLREIYLDEPNSHSEPRRSALSISKTNVEFNLQIRKKSVLTQQKPRVSATEPRCTSKSER